MANRNLDDVQALGKKYTIVSGSFAPNGSSAVSSASNKGIGWSVVRTSTGLFTITLQDSWVALLSAKSALQLATGDDKYLQFGTIDVVTNKTVQIRVWDASAAAVADISADANNRIHFELTLSNTQVNS